MKKCLAILFASIILAALFVGCGIAPAGQHETTAQPAGQQLVIEVDKIVGPWHLSEDSDLGALSETFPGAAEFGSVMEIRSDGNISWFIGADGAVGTYTVNGNTLSAKVTAELDGAECNVTFTQKDDDRLEMVFRDTVLVWVHGEGESLKGEE